MFEDGELQADSTVAFFATVQNEGDRKVARNLTFYNLDMIISVGYRVNSHRGVQFRIWATQVLREYLIKGFAMNDELLKNAGGGNYSWPHTKVYFYLCKILESSGRVAGLGEGI